MNQNTVSKQELLNKCDLWLEKYKELYDILTEEINNYDENYKLVLSFTESEHRGIPTYSIANAIQYKTDNYNWYELSGACMEIPKINEDVYIYLLSNCLMYAINKSDKTLTKEELTKEDLYYEVYLDQNERIKLKLDKKELMDLDSSLLTSLVELILMKQIKYDNNNLLSNIVKGNNNCDMINEYLNYTNDKFEELKEKKESKGKIQ